jgi:NADPH:quinone reductase-like Zn-dependent oxidoreductase
VDDNGAFAEYLVSSTHTLIRLPDSMSFEDAAQLGVSSFTASQMLWETLDLPRPTDASPPHEPITLLVWGGASATGQYAIQFAKLAGIKVITTASPKHFDRLKKLGADECFDYKDPEVSAKIRAATGNKLKNAADCISEESTYPLVSSALSEEGGKVSCINPSPENAREGVTFKMSFATDMLGKVTYFLHLARHASLCRLCLGV